MDKKNILKITIGILAFILLIALGYIIGNIVEDISKKEYIEKDITFVGIIEDIKSEKVIYVTGTNDNPKDFRKTYELDLNDNTIFVYNDEEINFDKLKIGDIVEVTFKGEYADIYPPLLSRVSKIELLDDDE